MLYCYVINYLKIQWLETVTISFSYILRFRNSRSFLPVLQSTWCWLESSTQLHSSGGVGCLEILQKLHSQVWDLSALHMVFTLLASFLTAWCTHGVRLLLQWLTFKRKYMNWQTLKLQISSIPALEITQHHFCHRLLIKTNHKLKFKRRKSRLQMM